VSIQIYPIVSRRSRFVGALANVGDFVYSEQQAITQATPLTTLTAEQFLGNPHFSLYCFEPTTAHAIFVELPSTVDLAAVPFVHQAQYEEALRVARVPLSLFTQLALQLPPVSRPIFQFMSARSGSTLLSQAFNASGVTSSLSEPDVLTQLVHLQTRAGQPSLSFSDAELGLLADSALRFLFRPGHLPRHNTEMTPAVKLRSEGVRLMALLQQAFPQATPLFLYRDTLGWVNSFHRIFHKLQMLESVTVDAWQHQYEGFLHTDLSHLRSFLAPQQQQLTLVEQLTLWWIAIMEWYLIQWQAGVPVLAVRYTDLNGARELTLNAIFAHCGLPAAAVQPALSAFAADSQAGTLLAREHPDQGSPLALTAQEVKQMVTILQRHPQLRHPNFWAPGTLDLALYRNRRQLLPTTPVRNPVTS
jgi:hypothetical protein